MVSKGFCLELTVKMLNHRKLELNGVTRSPPGKNLCQRKEEIPGSCTDLCGITSVKRADQRKKECRVLKGLSFGIVKF